MAGSPLSVSRMCIKLEFFPPIFPHIFFEGSVQRSQVENDV